MPVLDEFGREVPSVAGSGGDRGSGGDSRRDPDGDRYNSNDRQQSSQRDASRHDRLSSSLSSSRYPQPAPPQQPHAHHHEQQQQQRSHYGGGRYGDRSSSDRDRNYSSRDSRDNRGDRRGRHHRGGGDRGDSSYHHHHSHHRSHSPRNRSSQNNAGGPNNASAAISQQQQQQLKYPAMRYVSEPMLCEYLWKEQQEKENEKGNDDITTKTKSEEGDDSREANAEDGADSTKDVKTETDKEQIKEDEQQESQEKEHSSNNKSSSSSSYDDYRTAYGWKFLQHFFNQHLDDSWFRQLYSPAHACQLAKQEQERARDEAAAIKLEITSTTQDDQQNGGSSTNSTVAFVESARLGGGKKQQRYLPYQQQHQHHHHHSPPPPPPPPQQQPLPRSHLFSTSKRTLEIRDIPPHVTDSQILTALPALPLGGASAPTGKNKSSKQQQQQQQPAGNVVKLYSSTPVAKKAERIGGIKNKNHHHHHSNRDRDNRSDNRAASTNNNNHLHRTAYLVCADVATCDTLWRLLQDDPLMTSTTATTSDGAAATTTTAAPPALSSSTSSHIPRKDERHGNHSEGGGGGGGGGGASSTSAAGAGGAGGGVVVHLEVDCRDPYGRTEYDADGAGGPPEDGLAVPPRKAILRLVRHSAVPSAAAVSAQSSPESGPMSSSGTAVLNSVVVLSASLSTSARIAEDYEAATTIARALDVKQGIPQECRLDTLLDILKQQFPASAPATGDNDANPGDGGDDDKPGAPALTMADLLDISLAYLRRVHLMSFYKGCRKAESFANVLAGQEAASQIQLRLQQADEYLHQQQQKQQPPTSTTATATPTEAETAEDNTAAEDTTTPDAAAADATTEPVDTATTPTKAPDEDQAKDMLVQRLENDIRTAVEVFCPEWIAAGSSSSPLLVDETTDSAANEISNSEQEARATWLERHAIHDEEGRARCSFHFCHKLFKDQTFLRKHLMKKHGAFCVAEQAKCHDAFMMRAWEDTSWTCRGSSKTLASSSAAPVASSTSMEQSHQRPWFVVPPILVDCGTQFGLVESTLEATAPSDEDGTENPDKRTPQPMAADPEPLLWKQQEERRQAAEEMRQQRRADSRQRFQQMEEIKQQHRMNQHHDRHHQQQNQDGEGGGSGGVRRKFVDVDDMKEEVVEMTFEEVNLPAATSTTTSGTKKKKKKRKLL